MVVLFRAVDVEGCCHHSGSSVHGYHCGGHMTLIYYVFIVGLIVTLIAVIIFECLSYARYCLS